MIPSPIHVSVHAECLLKDIPGSEGPCTTVDGRIFMVSDPGSVLEVLPDGTVRELANTSGAPAGLQLDIDGSLLVADMKLGILRALPDGSVEDVVRTFEGQPIRGCNDLAFDTAGNLYFTAPAGSAKGDNCGEIFCRLATGEVRRLDAGFAFCNGIAVNADDSRLIVAETYRKQLVAYDLPEPGLATGKRVFAPITSDHRVGPDGIDFDANGNLIVTNWGGGCLDIFDPEGTLIRRIDLPFERPSNVHFVGPNSTELLVTEHQKWGLWRLDYGGFGQRQYGWAERQ